MKRAFALPSALSICLVLAACQAIPAPDTFSAELPPLASDASAAEQVIDALAQAERAAEANDPVELGRQLTRIDALGARFESELDQADIARWRAQAEMPPPMRGPVGGPAVRRGVLAPGSSIEFGQAFLAGEPASIAIQARSGPAVRISVANGQETTVCTRESRRGSCVWTPLFTQRHTITLTNQGSANSHYHLALQ